MKKIILLAMLMIPSVSSAQSVCQTRWYGGGYFTPGAGPTDYWGVTMDSPYAQFLFDYPGVAGAAEILSVGTKVPLARYEGKTYVWGDNGVKQDAFEWVPNSIEFGGWYVKQDGRYSGPYAPGAVGVKMTGARDLWKVTTTNWMPVAVWVEAWVLVRICGSEEELRKIPQ